MKKLLISSILLSFLAFSNLFAQFAERTDVIWARTVPAGTITMDGVLDEPEWAQAETLVLNYGETGLLPTSGWRAEFQPEVITYPTHAEIKFLVSSDNNLWLGFIIPDSSIGGTQDWARWDGILMSIKDKLILDPTIKFARPVEYFYTWYTSGLPNPDPIVGAPPRFIGRYGNFTDTTRTASQIENWDAKTIVNGISNDDQRDVSWVVEMRCKLDSLGYDVTQPEGDFIMLNFSIWDCDYLFEGDPTKINTTRTHWQSPWGNANGNNVARVFARPDVTVSTATLPVVAPDVLIPNGADDPEPAIDGKLYEPIWNGAYTFNIAWNDSLLRMTYPGAGKYMSGQFQPELGGNPRPPVLDPSFGTVKFFFKDQYLFLGVDVNDQLVQGTEVYDKGDGIGFILGDRSVKNEEDVMEFRLLRANFGIDGMMHGYDYLPNLVDSGFAWFAGALKEMTTVNVNSDIDSGYSIEMKVDLTKFGYPPDLGDKLLFMGADLYDGDSFDDSLANYGTRTWWFREHAGGPAVPWMVLDPNTSTGVDENTASIIPDNIKIYGNYPNPFNPSTTIKYALPQTGNVKITVYNSLGELVSVINKLNQQAGEQSFNFDASSLASGIYFYKVALTGSGKSFESGTGKMILLK